MSRMLVLISTVVFLLLLCGVASFVSIKRDMVWVDSTTGSTKHQNLWIFGIKGQTTIKPSVLDQWVRDRGGQVNPDWRLVKGTWENLWGTSLRTGHGTAPAIYQLRGYPLEEFVKNGTDEQIKALVTALQSGSESEQEAAVEIALDVAMNGIDRYD